MTTLGLSVVIPTLQARLALVPTLEALGEGRTQGLVEEILVVDGGSSDGTVELARDAGARVVASSRGRGVQLARGAAAARGDWLLFLHADTALAPGWATVVARFIAQGPDRAGYFRFALDDPTPPARRLEKLVAWRSRVLGLPYGDQGLLISRALYLEIGGYRDVPLMEDVDLVRRLGRSRLAAIPLDAVTSAERFRRTGYRRRSARNLVCLSLYFLGVPPRLIVKLYA